MNWIKVTEFLPEKGNDVLCMMRTADGKTIPVIRWRSEYDDTVVDSNGFIIYNPVEVEVIAWMEIPKYKHSTTSKKSNRSSKSIKTFTVNGVSFNMIYVEGNTFKMGATKEQGKGACTDEKPVHNVTLSDYYIGEVQVTQELWQAVMDGNPSFFAGNLQHPVESVTWDDCQKFIMKLNTLTGKTFRLPTEAEWEYAARGGYKSRGYKYAGSNTLDDVAWYNDNSWDIDKSRPNFGTHPVKQKQPNELGLYDMSGNVWEWCLDKYGNYSKSPQTNPIGISNGIFRVLRGGGWSFNDYDCRVSRRDNLNLTFNFNAIGFRLVLTID